MDLQNTFIRKPENIVKYVVKVKYVATHTHEYGSSIKYLNQDVYIMLLSEFYRLHI